MGALGEAEQVSSEGLNGRVAGRRMQGGARLHRSGAAGRGQRLALAPHRSYANTLRATTSPSHIGGARCLLRVSAARLNKRGG